MIGTRDEEKEQIAMDYKETFGTESGKRVLANLKKLAKMKFIVLSYDKTGRLDLGKMAYDNGQKSVVLHIESKIDEDLGRPKHEIVKNVKE